MHSKILLITLQIEMEAITEMEMTVIKEKVDERFTLVRHKVRDGIQRMIIGGEYRTGEKLAQQKLAQRFGVGQGLIREALLELQMTGLIETKDNRGMFVGELSADLLFEAYRIREMHEGLAVRLCCENMTRAEISGMKLLVEEIYEAGKVGDMEKMGQLDRQFHNEILEKCGNKLLIRLVDSYSILQKIVRGKRNPIPVKVEHMAILDAIEQGRADDAERLMREHIATGRKFVEDQVKSGAFIPEWVKNGRKK